MTHDVSDETDTTSEVARVLGRTVLGLHPEPGPKRDEMIREAAEALAGAGLLRDHVTIDALNQRCQILVDKADRLRAQIATQEPAGATQGGSGDSRASGGSCARCGTGITLPAGDPENREMAVCAPCEIAVLKEGYMAARAQVERVRAQLVRMTKSSDEKTQRHGNALLRILDGEEQP